jgi:hypothetical protein
MKTSHVLREVREPVFLSHLHEVWSAFRRQLVSATPVAMIEAHDFVIPLIMATKNTVGQKGVYETRPYQSVK